MQTENLHINSLLFRFPEAQDNMPEHFHEAKTKYNKLIFDFFRARNFITSANFVKDTEVCVFSHQETYDSYSFDVYDRFCLKINYNHIYAQPEIIVSYERTMRVLSTSIAELSTQQPYSNDPFEISSIDNNPLSMINRVVEKYTYEDDPTRVHLRVFPLKKVQERIRKSENPRPLNNEYLYPVINQELQIFFQIPFNRDDDDNPYEPVNRYKRYLDKINTFIKAYLLKPDFQKILQLAHEFTPVQAAQMQPPAMQLRFADNKEHRVPQMGLNFGTFQQPVDTNIVLFYICPNGITREEITALNTSFMDMYGKPERYPYQGLRKYIGVAPQQEPGLSFFYDPNNRNAAEQIAQILETKNNILNKPDKTFVCCFLSAVNKDNLAAPQHELYYQVKELLLRRGIVSQCIDISKMRETLNNDKRRNRDNFKYSLQNMSVAINAKLGGMPWILSVPPQRELVIGVGAFRQGKRQYIGAAFVFQNTGAFNEYTYFAKNDIQILAGAIEEKIIEFTQTYQPPTRLIIHYYKRMKEKDAQHITDMLNHLNLSIPVFILTINETESESVFVFDNSNPELMPYSGRYISLGENDYLLCNNTRYENSPAKPDSYAFPVKIHIQCNAQDALQMSTITQLLQQVYQFSRIYYKSVKQQNLPVSILYPKMIAEIMMHFQQQGVTNTLKNRLWFL